jgi:hypothetical protein
MLGSRYAHQKARQILHRIKVKLLTQITYCEFCLSGQNRQNLRIFSENPKQCESNRTKSDFYYKFNDHKDVADKTGFRKVSA